MDKVTNSYKLIENKTLEITLSDDEAEALKALESKIANFVSGLPDDNFEDEDRRFKITFLLLTILGDMFSLISIL